MGQGDIGGNGSVQWTFVHHGAGPGGGARPFSCAAAPPAGTDRVDVGGNRATSTDPILFTDIGKPRAGAQDLVRGNFKVTFHYGSPADATAALANAWVAGTSVVLYVPAVDRTGGANANRPTEIIIEW